MSTVNMVSVSGGKDSTATLLLAIATDVPDLRAVFADTGHEHPATYDYVDYLSDATGIKIERVKADFRDAIVRKRERLKKIADGELVDIFGKYRWTPEKAARAIPLLEPTGIPFLDLCLLKGMFPSTRARFCSEELKRNPIIEFQMGLIDAGHSVMSWQGVRADESPARARLPSLDEVGGGLWNYRPILRWTVEDVFEAHRVMGVKPNPLYQQGMGRVGCMPCIHAGKDELREIGLRFPDEIARVAEWERLVGAVTKGERGTATLFHEADGRGSNIWQAVEWSMTSRGGRQLDLDRMFQPVEACSSIYGLCE